MNELLKEGLLDVNAIFLIESEEESGRVGFYEAVNQNKELFLGCGYGFIKVS